MVGRQEEWSSGRPSSREEVTSDQDYPTFSHAAAADAAAEVDIRNNPGVSICAGSHFPLFPDRTFTKRTQRGYNDPIRVFGKVTHPDLKWKCSLNLLWVYIKSIKSSLLFLLFHKKNSPWDRTIHQGNIQKRTRTRRINERTQREMKEAKLMEPVWQSFIWRAMSYSMDALIKTSADLWFLSSQEALIHIISCNITSIEKCHPFYLFFP